jgi:hypothetical protein
MKQVKKCQCTIGKSVLFQNNKYSIETYLNNNTNTINIVVVIDKMFTDWAIKYTTGQVAYDHPEKIAPYIKRKVFNYYQKY